MSTHDSTTALSTDAEQAPTDVRLTALRQALTHVGTITATLSDLSAALKEGEAPGIAWATDYIADGVHALTSEIAELVKAEEERTGPTRLVEGDPPRTD